MKMDMDLIRELLTEISEERVETLDVEDARIFYHLEMLAQKKFTEGIYLERSVDGFLSVGLNAPRLTYDGNEFVGTTRPKKAWENIKKFVSDKGAGLTIDAIKIAAPIVLTGMLGSSK